MADPDFNESAWRRAISSTGAIYGSTTFQLALGLVTIIVGSFAVLLGDGSTKDQIASAIFITASGVALVLLLVFAVQLALAPTHQRNELRRNWPGAVVEEPPNVELTLRNFSRIGDDLVKRITGYGGYVDSDDRELAENWTQDVVHFLSQYEPQEAASFTDASKGESEIRDQLAARVEALDKIIERVAPAARASTR